MKEGQRKQIELLKKEHSSELASMRSQLQEEHQQKMAEAEVALLETVQYTQVGQGA